MLKKYLYMSLAALTFNSPAMAIEIPAEPESTFNYEATAYSSEVFNRILEAHGLSFMVEHAAAIDASYATLNGNEPVFNDLSRVYTPQDYHTILTAYGLELSPENAVKLQVRSYAAVVAGEVVFGDTSSIAYGGWAWRSILSAYTPVQAVAGPVVEKATIMVDSDGDGVADSSDECADTPKGVEVNERGCWEYSGVLFELNNAEITPAFQVALNNAGRIFKLNPGLRVVVEGHTCNLGAAEYNQHLSERRAKAVADYLVNEAGVNAASVKWVGYGEDLPVYGNGTEEGRVKNRRVQFRRQH